MYFSPVSSSFPPCACLGKCILHCSLSAAPRLDVRDRVRPCAALLLLPTCHCRSVAAVTLGFAQSECSERVDERQDTRGEGSRRRTPMLKSSLDQERGDENILMHECLRTTIPWFFAKSRTSQGSITSPLTAF